MSPVAKMTALPPSKEPMVPSVSMYSATATAVATRSSPECRLVV